MQDNANKSQPGDQATFFERINYYFGKMMLVRDFKAEQSYHNEKRWLTNRLGFGWGTLCGLEVQVKEKSELSVIVQPGLALDNYGHEIWITEEQSLNLEKLVPEKEAAASPPESPTEYYLTVMYFECKVEPSPIPIEDCGKFDQDCEHNRIREHFKFQVHLQPIEKPEPAAIKDANECLIDAYRLLKNPAVRITESCSTRNECDEIPLARIYYDEKGELTVDNANYRQMAFNTNMLFDYIDALKEEVWKFHETRYDRRRSIPILAQTVRGIDFQDGKLATIDQINDAHFVRAAFDGKSVWFTDCNSSELMRIDQDDPLHNPGYRPCPEKPAESNGNNWGIAFDGKYMWVTHHESASANGDDGAITGINVCDTGDKQQLSIKGLKSNPKEIVYDGEFLWISHTCQDGSPSELSHYLSRVNPRDCSFESYELELDNLDPQSSDPGIKAMTFDGQFIWGVYDTPNMTGLIGFKKNENGEPDVGRPIFSGHNRPGDLAFDGSHLWIAHEDGLTRIDIQHPGDNIKTNDTTDTYTALCCDGDYIWAAEPSNRVLNQVNRMNAKETGDVQISLQRTGYAISKMIFDGRFLWVAAHEENNNVKKGIIHRVLV